MARDAIAVAAPHYRTMVKHLPEIIDGARTAVVRRGTMAAFARTAHILRNSDPAVVCWLAAAALVQLAEAAEATEPL